MKEEKAIKLLASSILGIIIDQVFSITQIIKEAIDPAINGPFLEPAKPLILLCFFIAEIGAIFEILDNIKLFDKILE